MIIGIGTSCSTGKRPRPKRPALSQDYSPDCVECGSCSPPEDNDHHQRRFHGSMEIPKTLADTICRSDRLCARTAVQGSQGAQSASRRPQRSALERERRNTPAAPDRAPKSRCNIARLGHGASERPQPTSTRAKVLAEDRLWDVLCVLLGVEWS